MNVDEYVNYVEKQLELFEESNNLLRNNYVIASDLNKALANYGSVNDALIAEHQRRKQELFEAELDFKAWWDEKYVFVRRELNPVDVAKAKWLSKGEVESEVRVRFSEEYREKITYYKDFEHKVAFMRRLLERWKMYKDILVNLCQNMRQDMRSLHIDDEANYVPEAITDDTQNLGRRVRG